MAEDTPAPAPESPSEGDVVVIKGTMVLKADKVVITEDKYGFQLGVATGGKDGLARSMSG